uniref:Protein ripply2 n=1 Tax=Pyxicephalus adspersus TaxID=30357 RepID=A0AAV3APU3_PYXAD|nr:TPA: hypothetical protein GDO54_010720 [Pyxicephalus adspersus]
MTDDHLEVCLRLALSNCPDSATLADSLQFKTSSRLHEVFWRPWINNSTRQLRRTLPYATGLCENPQSVEKPAEYNHPVRLFWPKSKPLHSMYLEAANLLQSFPVQATLSFYNDSESDSEDDESSEEEHDSGFESE